MPKEKENLQSALQQLEKIVEDLSKKDVDVEAGLEKFKEGVALIKVCRGQLQKAENEFKKLKNELDIEGDEETDDEEDEEGEPVNSEKIPFWFPPSQKILSVQQSGKKEGVGDSPVGFSILVEWYSAGFFSAVPIFA